MAEDLIRGWHAVAAVLEYEPERLRGLLVERGRHDARARALLDQAASLGVPVYPVDRAELDRSSGGARHQGIVARVVSSQRVYGEADLSTLLAADEPALLLVLDGVQDPHNLGACLRSAAAAGVHAVIAPTDRAASLNATVRKVASDAAEIVPFVQVTNLARTLRGLQEQGLWIVGAVGEAESSL